MFLVDLSQLVDMVEVASPRTAEIRTLDLANGNGSAIAVSSGGDGAAASLFTALRSFVVSE